MEYSFKEIEQKWQKFWIENQTYKVGINKMKPKFYVLDMFPYPSGAGLHVGHPLGYIASDIYSRFKRLKGFNVLHPMGYDAYGLPAEQYAIQTGQHPAITTNTNIKRYREQLDKIGFSFDWSREVKTCEPNYYKWTQWAFIEMFNRYFDIKLQKSMPINDLIAQFEKSGTEGITSAFTKEIVFTAAEWNAKSEHDKQETLLNYRLAYLADTVVNWCPFLGTVLANDEVKDGLSVRGGHPVEQRVMRQWSLRVSAYAQRLLDGLDTVEWSDSIKEVQRNWIGRSEGAEMLFAIKNSDIQLEIFTTRADTVFGVTFMVLAPESILVDSLTTAAQRSEVDDYILETKKRTERERQSNVTRVTGVFSGAYAINPLSGEQIPIWISDYVLAGYGTGAIMAVPAHDSRDFAFAKHFNLPIIQVVVPIGEQPSDATTWSESIDAKEGTMVNSGFLNGLSVLDAIAKTKLYIKEKGIGNVKVNFRLRDAIFSRQRYWGEPFPIYYKDGLPYTVPLSDLPIELPEVDKYLPTETGEPPLGRAKNWHTKDGYPLEMNTMPGFAGSSAYYLRYMDPSNEDALVSKEANDYWQEVDLYIGGNEHATGHLIYSRVWNKFLYDINAVCKDEPFKKLINQGMIQGRSNFVYRLFSTNIFFSQKHYIEILRRNSLAKTKEDVSDIVEYICRLIRTVNPNHPYLNRKPIDGIDFRNLVVLTQLHVDVNIVSNDQLDIEKFKAWGPDNKDAEFILEDGKYVCGWAVEKMSKSMYNVVNPDDIVENYGADTLRLYEMFLGPLEQSKPWDTNGIDGVHKFLRKLFRLFSDKNGVFNVSEEAPSADELKVLHKTIKKITGDIETFSFNTSVSAFMICVNELTDLKCNKREILTPLVVLIAPFAPHSSEELWNKLGQAGTVCDAKWPLFEEKYLVESEFTYPVSFNGKTRFMLTLPADLSVADIEKIALAHETSVKWIEGKPIKKLIIIPNKIINIVV